MIYELLLFHLLFYLSPLSLKWSWIEKFCSSNHSIGSIATLGCLVRYCIWHLVSEYYRSQLGTHRNTKARRSIMAAHPKNTGPIEGEADPNLSPIHERFSRFKLSQHECTSWVGRMEGWLDENSRAMGKMINMLESLMNKVRLEKGENSSTTQYWDERPRFTSDPKCPIVEEMGEESLGEKDMRFGNYQQPPQRTNLPKVDFQFLQVNNLVNG